jgi:iron complex outermembrane receptor protein
MKLSVDGCIRRSVYAAFAAGIASVAAPAFAQEAVSAPAAPEAAPAPAAETAAKSDKSAVKLERVQVTGSRIRQPNLSSASPITTISSAEIKYQGTTRVEDLLNNLPQVFADQGGNIANGSTGTANVDLRDLGSARTLVLIDGKRVQPGDPRTNSPSVDLNFIPAALIDRVDVLTGGASATYGADAVAGVVNFVMKKDFEGVRLDAQRSIYNHSNGNDNATADAVRRRNGAQGFSLPNDTVWDGQGWDLTAVVGGNFGDGKGNATAYASYRQLDPITQDRRDFSACTVAVPTVAGAPDPNSTTFNCSGSSTTFPGRFLSADNGSNSTIDATTGNTFRPFTAADQFNFGPYNFFQRNDERYMMGAFAHYKFNEHADAYTQLMFMDDRTNAVIAPSGAFFGGGPTVNAGNNIFFENPLLSAQQRDTLFGADTDPDPAVDSRTGSVADVLIGRRNFEGGGRDDDLRHTSYRILLGMRGDLWADWSYDTFAQYGTTNYQQIYRNDFSVVRTTRALDVVTDNRAGSATVGQPVCRSVVDGTDPNCVPYNIWTLGAVTPEALSYLQTPGFSSGTAVERVVGASASGNLPFTSPFAKDAVGLAFGVEYRSETSIAEADTEFVTGDLAGQGGAFTPTQGAFDVREFYTEARLPIWQDMPFGKDLSVGLGYRYSDYSAFDSTDTYKIDLTYAPIDDIKARFSYNRAVRAPSINELSSPLSVALDGNTDPCAGAAPTATAAQCANDPVIGANPALYGTIIENPASQYNGLLGSSPGLQAEEADTFTYGLVFTPTFIKGASFSIDYYRIKVEGFIDGYGADTILDQCYNNGALCSLINRDPNTGSLWLGQNGYVIDTTQNTGSLLARGIDFKGDYRLRLSDVGLKNSGSVTIDFVGSYLLEQEIQPIPGAASSTYNCEGKYGPQCGAPVSEWRHKLRTTWNMPWYNSAVSVAWRYLGGVEWDGVGATNTLDKKLDAENYLDLYGSIRAFGKASFRVGVNNVLDNDPPIVGQGALTSVSGNGNTYPQVYDALGRYLFAGVTVDF